MSSTISLQPSSIASWSNVQPTTTSILAYRPSFAGELADLPLPFIPRGAGRSFGDAAYITNGITLTSQLLDRIIACDWERGEIVCESGVSMDQLHTYLDRTEWTFPIYGGTRLATVGGAVAADIHGKNDVKQGSFGNHVQSLVLVTPDGQDRECSPQIAPDLFRATIAGMGLTGLIKTATLKLQRGLPRSVRLRSRPVFSLDDAIDCFDHSASDFQFCTWTSYTSRSARGLFFYASYAQGEPGRPRTASEIRLPTTRLFNRFLMPAAGQVMHLLCRNLDQKVHVMDFNFIGVHERFKHWNRVYQRAGLIEYHFVVSAEHLCDAVAALVRMCHKQGLTLHFGILKRFGGAQRAGLLSFPRQGYTLNFQVEDRAETRKLLIDFTDVLIELKGRVYLAKDACILPRQFEGMYEGLDEWRNIALKYDPANKIQSDLSVRLGLKPW